MESFRAFVCVGVPVERTRIGFCIDCSCNRSSPPKNSASLLSGVDGRGGLGQVDWVAQVALHDDGCIITKGGLGLPGVVLSGVAQPLDEKLALGRAYAVRFAAAPIGEVAVADDGLDAELQLAVYLNGRGRSCAAWRVRFEERHVEHVVTLPRRRQLAISQAFLFSRLTDFIVQALAAL